MLSSKERRKEEAEEVSGRTAIEHLEYVSGFFASSGLLNIF